jgi:signal transduction histidine kinase
VKKKLLFIFILIIFMPITVMTVMAVYTYKENKSQRLEKYKEEASNILLSNARLLQNRLIQVEGDLDMAALDPSRPAQELRTDMNMRRLVKQAFIIDEANTFLFPDIQGDVSRREEEFLKEAENIDLAAGLRAGFSQSEDKMIQSHWYTWFMGDGINFIYYTLEDKTLKGFLLERYALISQLINVLPVSTGRDDSFRIQLTDARGDVLYQWGEYQIEESAQPLREYSLKEPLGSWRLFYYFNIRSLLGNGTDLSAFYLIPGLALLTLIIFIMAIYFYRENTREMKTAQNQVSFVNQVSHELKTPLTNIRLYSELLQNLLTDPRELSYLNVIVNEGSRLGRMINNVLTFSRGERGELKRQIENVNLGELINEVLGKFKPLLEKHSMEYEYEEMELPLIETDRDMVEQILVNIISNAVKYGASGKYLGIQTKLNDETCTVFIRDRGPGIEDSEKIHIFKPFYRIDNSLSQSSSGTGIGLSIACTLARESGASLKLEESQKGCCFSLTIPLKEDNN